MTPIIILGLIYLEIKMRNIQAKIDEQISRVAGIASAFGDFKSKVATEIEALKKAIEEGEPADFSQLESDLDALAKYIKES